MKKKILICEDDAMIGGMYKTKLEQEGHMVFLADNGASGLSMALSQKPDLILLDIMLPDGDGRDFLTAHRRNANRKHECW